MLTMIEVLNSKEIIKIKLICNELCNEISVEDVKTCLKYCVEAINSKNLRKAGILEFVIYTISEMKDLDKEIRVEAINSLKKIILKLLQGDVKMDYDRYLYQKQEEYDSKRTKVVEECFECGNDLYENEECYYIGGHYYCQNCIDSAFMTLESTSYFEEEY